MMSGTRRKPGAMAPYITAMDAKLAAAGYTPGTRRGMLKIVGDVGRWLDTRCRVWSRASPASWTTWNGSITSAFRRRRS